MKKSLPVAEVRTQTTLQLIQDAKDTNTACFTANLATPSRLFVFRTLALHHST